MNFELADGIRMVDEVTKVGFQNSEFQIRRLMIDFF